jgi:hypothetical protein
MWKYREIRQLFWHLYGASHSSRAVKLQFCSRSLAEIAGSNPAGSTDICMF